MQKSVLSFHLAYFADRTQDIRLGSNHLHTLSELNSPIAYIYVFYRNSVLGNKLSLYSFILSLFF